MKYQVLTNASIGGNPVWATTPFSAYGVARCVNWRDEGQIFSAIRWGN